MLVTRNFLGWTFVYLICRRIVDRSAEHYKNKTTESVSMDNYEDDYSVAIICAVLLVVSLVVVCGVAWAVN